MMETQGWIVPWEKEDSHIDSLLVFWNKGYYESGDQGWDRSGWGVHVWTSGTVCGVNNARYGI